MLNYNQNMPVDNVLLQKNHEYSEEFKKSPMMELLNNKKIADKEYRARLLDAIQVISDYFQKVVMIRYAMCDNKAHLGIATEHLAEEFGHNIILDKNRNNRPATWDPILEATSAWFTWKMFTLDNDEKIVLIHLILETSANIFFQKAELVLKKYMNTEYFKIHSEADEKHEKMGLKLLKTDAPESLKRLLIIQKQGWEMLLAMANQIANLTNKNESSKVLYQRF